MIYLGLSLNTINLLSLKHRLVFLVSQYELQYLVIQVSQWRYELQYFVFLVSQW